MTSSRFRRRRRKPAFRGDFPGDGRTATELISSIRPASWDGTTIRFADGGASGAGLDPGSIYPLPAPVAAIAPPPVAERYPATFTAPPSIPATPARPGHDIVARDMAAGWPHLFEVRCAYPPAASTTPIPCGAVHRDPAATSFPALRASARAARWHPDAYGRWACPRCGQASGEYRTRRPVAIRAEGAPAARGEMWDYHEVYGGDPALTPDGQILTVAAEHVLTVRAAYDLRERTLRHYDNSHKRGVHADGA